MKSRQINDSDCFHIATPFEEVWKELTAHRHNAGKGCLVRIKATPSAVTIINGSYSDYPCKVITCSDTAESVDVLEPEPLRWSLADFARQVLSRYSK